MLMESPSSSTVSFISITNDGFVIKIERIFEDETSEMIRVALNRIKDDEGSVSLEKLLEIVSPALKRGLREQGASLSYVDEHGDVISIKSSEDLLDAIEQTKHLGYLKVESRFQELYHPIVHRFINTLISAHQATKAIHSFPAFCILFALAVLLLIKCNRELDVTKYNNIDQSVTLEKNSGKLSASEFVEILSSANLDPVVYPTCDSIEWNQEGYSIVGYGTNDRYGNVISMSSDGNIIAVGIPNETAYSRGVVRVYQRKKGGSWSKLGNDIFLKPEVCGHQVSLSEDGMILAASCSSGFVLLLEYGKTGWIQQKVYSGATKSISLSSSSSRVAIGYETNETGELEKGLAIMEDIGSDGWKELVSVMGNYNASVISSSGKVVAVGSPLESDNRGTVSVFTINKEQWATIGSKIVGISPGDEFGKIMALSADGTVLAVGTPGNSAISSQSGMVRVFELNEQGEWDQKGESITGDAARDRCGDSLSLSSDGSMLVIGCPGKKGVGFKSGAAIVLKFDGDAWMQYGTPIEGGAAFEECGRSVFISPQGDMIVVGCPFYDGGYSKNVGRVRLFRAEY